jgi:hypothetical protein
MAAGHEAPAAGRIVLFAGGRASGNGKGNDERAAAFEEFAARDTAMRDDEIHGYALRIFSRPRASPRAGSPCARRSGT